MHVNVDAVRRHLKAFDFKRLMVEELGWNKYRSQPLEVQIGSKRYALEAVAEKCGMVVLAFNSAVGMPPYPERRKIEQRVRGVHHEHLIIFCDADRKNQIWQWVKREQGGRTSCREHVYHDGSTGQALVEKLQALAFSLEEEENLTITDVTARTRALDVEKVTKKFYERFTKEHKAFLKFIGGIEKQVEREWYASIMLNRMMFVYFIQKRGFLDGDRDYLRQRLRAMQERKGKDQFNHFYRLFLRRLFHEGLAQPECDRAPDLAALLGKVPYLNGGIFDEHELERTHADIHIPDKAFEAIFNFFDAYEWHLDQRPLRADNEINPDVVGYIFEKYINQKEMGAYYTKEDITGYIGRNTILPWLFDAAKKECKIAFEPNGGVWRLLREDPERYIHDAVRKGVNVPLPKEIAAGIGDKTKRGDWNRPAAEEVALPMETWREYIARRQHYAELGRKLASGEVSEINDLITLNLDIGRFAVDVIESSEGPELVKAFWKALNSVSVLDPTCGSGAFLFAALNILEPLYAACLEGMQGFVDDVEQTDGKNSKKLENFRLVLADMAKHPNPKYFVLKSIVLNNLYGVDIMAEAVEICKLRLFLKLVAQLDTYDQIEPLPDIDFNVRVGNTLVGFTSQEEIVRSQRERLGFDQAHIDRISEDAEVVEKAYVQFRLQQTQHSDAITTGHKQDLLRRLNALDDTLDRYIAVEYGVSPDNVRSKKAYEEQFEKWRSSHQPLHWFAEFYGVMARGGFDVVVGNPPYVAASKVRKLYVPKGFRTLPCSDIYAWVMERTVRLLAPSGRSGLIVPLSLGFSSDFLPCREMLFTSYGVNWFSHFGRIPSALFNFDVRVRNVIHIGSKAHQTENCCYTSRLHRWFEAERLQLFQRLEYASFTPKLWSNRIPKVNTEKLVKAFEIALADPNRRLAGALASGASPHGLHFKKTAYNWLNFCPQLPPCYVDDQLVEHTKFGQAFFATAVYKDLALALLNGKFMLVYWFAIGDDFDVTRWNFEEFPCDFGRIDSDCVEGLRSLSTELRKAMENAVQFKLNAGRRVGNFNLAKCRHVTDKCDAILARSMGFTDVLDDVELYYIQTMRTTFDDDEE